MKLEQVFQKDSFKSLIRTAFVNSKTVRSAALSYIEKKMWPVIVEADSEIFPLHVQLGKYDIAYSSNGDPAAISHRGPAEAVSPADPAVRSYPYRVIALLDYACYPVVEKRVGPCQYGQCIAGDIPTAIPPCGDPDLPLAISQVSDPGEERMFPRSIPVPAPVVSYAEAGISSDPELTALA